MKSKIHSLAAAYEDFGFRVLSQLVQSAEANNVAVSPLSVAIALVMTYNGANAETEAASARVLGIENRSLQEVNAANQSLFSKLGNLGAQVQIALANSL